MVDVENPVTWNEMIGMSSFIGMIFTGGVGWCVKAINDLRKQLDEHRVEVAKEYASQHMVIQIEQRLTDSINRMSDQLTTGMAHLTDRFEAMFTQVLDISRARDKAE